METETPVKASEMYSLLSEKDIKEACAIRVPSGECEIGTSKYNHNEADIIERSGEMETEIILKRSEKDSVLFVNV